MSTRQMIASSQDFLTAALSHLPDGMLEVVDEAHRLPTALENHHRAMDLRFRKAQEFPLHPSIVGMYQAVQAAQAAVVKAAEEIGPAIEQIHKTELDRLRHQRRNEQMWDVRSNQGRA